MYSAPGEAEARALSTCQGDLDEVVAVSKPAAADLLSQGHQTRIGRRHGARRRTKRPNDIKLTSFYIPELEVSIKHTPDGQEIIKGRGCCGRVLKAHSPHFGSVAVKVIADVCA